MIKSMKNKFSSGISNISYRLIKKGFTELHYLLILLANFCLRFGIISDQWKIMSLYPIPKPYDWNFSIALTRPIILIECTKIVGNRLIAGSSKIGTNFILKKGLIIA